MTDDPTLTPDLTAYDERSLLGCALHDPGQAVLARLDRIAVTLDRLLFVQLANHDNRHATIPPKKALAAPTFPGKPSRSEVQEADAVRSSYCLTHSGRWSATARHRGWKWTKRAG